MPVSPEYRAFALEQLEQVAPVTARAMFGGVGLYSDGLFFALIDDDTLYFKVDEENRGDFEAEGMGPFKPFGDDSYSMHYYELPADLLEDPERLREWMEKALAADHSRCWARSIRYEGAAMSTRGLGCHAAALHAIQKAQEDRDDLLLLLGAGDACRAIAELETVVPELGMVAALDDDPLGGGWQLVRVLFRPRYAGDAVRGDETTFRVTGHDPAELGSSSDRLAGGAEPSATAVSVEKPRRGSSTRIAV